jgi:hypothetical protein
MESLLDEWDPDESISGPAAVLLEDRRRRSKNTVTWLLKAGIVERIGAVIARQQRRKHVTTATNNDATIRDAMFSMLSVPMLYNEDQLDKLYKYGDLAFQIGGSRIWDSKMWSRVPRESDLRITALARASGNCKPHTDPLLGEDVAYGLWKQVLSWKKVLVVSLKGLVAKKNWLAVSRQS